MPMVDVQVPIIVTRHAKTRYVQRVLKKHEADDVGALRYADTNAKDISIAITNLIRTGKEDRSFTNDSQFMSYLWEKYGDERLTLIINGRIMFVMGEKQTGRKTLKIVKTLVDANKPPREFYRQNNRRLLSRGISPTIKPAGTS